MNKNGTIDIHTTRESSTDLEGNINEFGELTGIEPYSQEEFNKRDLSSFYGSTNTATNIAGGIYDSSISFANQFEKYKEFGIEYIESETASGSGDVYYNGQLINTFIDINPSGGTFSFQSQNSGEFSVQTIYDNNGELIGLKQIY